MWLGSHNEGIEIWDAATGEHLRSIVENLAPFSPLYFSPNSEYIASLSTVVKEILIWEVRTGSLAFNCAPSRWSKEQCFSFSGASCEECIFSDLDEDNNIEISVGNLVNKTVTKISSDDGVKNCSIALSRIALLCASGEIIIRSSSPQSLCEVIQLIPKAPEFERNDPLCATLSSDSSVLLVSGRKKIEIAYRLVGDDYVKCFVHPLARICDMRNIGQWALMAPKSGGFCVGAVCSDLMSNIVPFPGSWAPSMHPHGSRFIVSCCGSNAHAAHVHYKVYDVDVITGGETEPPTITESNFVLQLPPTVSPNVFKTLLFEFSFEQVILL